MTSPERRDHLAIERTQLANERTFLAYVRTAVSIGALGIVALHFLSDASSRMVGILAIVVGGFIFLVGVWRFRGGRSRIEGI